MRNKKVKELRKAAGGTVRHEFREYDKPIFNKGTKNAFAAPITCKTPERLRLKALKKAYKL